MTVRESSGAPGHVRVMTAADIREAITVEDAILAQREAFRQLAAGWGRVPHRTIVTTEHGTTLFMPGSLPDADALGLKVVSVMPRNPSSGLPAVPGVILLVSPTTGRPLALIEGTYLTALRTAAASALATDLLADASARVLAVFGAGAQAREHIRTIRSVRPIEEVRIVSRTVDRAEALAASLADVRADVRRDPADAVHGADIVVTATSSSTPVFDGRDVAAGTHVNAIGAYTPDTREIDEHVVARARIVVDTREGALAEAGDLLLPIAAGVITESDIDAELGEILLGARPRGRDGREITFYKSVGTAAQDLVTARRALDAATSKELGTLVAL